MRNPMCCFSGPVRAVHDTKIFARPGEKEEQFLVYSMSIDAPQDLAMILPLPVRMPAQEDELKFIDLKDYPDFFSDMERGFPRRETYSWSFHSGATPASATAALPVVSVGDFEASFVPTQKDFPRLDERFRLPDGVWEKLPAYSDYGFAVFKLKPGAMSIHPMAFSFPRRDARTVFFPTVHIHDGKVHASAEFDHTLYCQPRHGERLAIHKWEESSTTPASFMKMEKANGILLRDQHCFKRAMTGRLANRDTLVQVES